MFITSSVGMKPALATCSISYSNIGRISESLDLGFISDYKLTLISYIDVTVARLAVC